MEKTLTKTFLFFWHLLVSCSLDLFAFILFDISSFYNGLIIANVPKAMFSCLTQQPTASKTCIWNSRVAGHTCLLTRVERWQWTNDSLSEHWSEMKNLSLNFNVPFMLVLDVVCAHNTHKLRCIVYVSMSRKLSNTHTCHHTPSMNFDGSIKSTFF